MGSHCQIPNRCTLVCRAGQWSQACKLFDSTHSCGNRADPTFYHTAIDILWSTGVHHIQMKAVQLFNSLPTNGRSRLGVQSSCSLGVHEILLQPWSVGSTTIAIYKWLFETRYRIHSPDPGFSCTCILLRILNEDFLVKGGGSPPPNLVPSDFLFTASREKIDKDCDYLSEATIVIAMGRGRNGKSSSARIVMNAVFTMLSGAKSPFRWRNINSGT